MTHSNIGPTTASDEAPSTPPWPDIDPFEEAAARAARTAPVDKSKLFRSEVQRLRDPGHLRYVAGLACLVCGRKPSHAHHLRFAQPKALGRKVSDEFTVPLCNLHHREVHTRGNEESWWQEKKLSPLAIASELWVTSRRHRGATALQSEFLRGNLPDLHTGASTDNETDTGPSDSQRRRCYLMTEDRIKAIWFICFVLWMLADGLTRCMLPPIYSEYGEDPKDRE